MSNIIGNWETGPNRKPPPDKPSQERGAKGDRGFVPRFRRGVRLRLTRSPQSRHSAERRSPSSCPVARTQEGINLLQWTPASSSTTTAWPASGPRWGDLYLIKQVFGRSQHALKRENLLLRGRGDGRAGASGSRERAPDRKCSARESPPPRAGGTAGRTTPPLRTS